MNRTKNNQIIVIGAGISGLSASWHLREKGIDCVVLEKEPVAGGLCRSKSKRGFVFDYCGHVFHFKHRYAYAFIRKILGGNLRKHRRKSWIYFRGNYVRYPFQANLRGLPPAIIRECLLGFINPGRSAASHNGCFLGWINRTFGPGIARHFMVPYNEKFWTVHPREMTCDWMENFIPVPTLRDVVTGTVADSRKRFGYNADFWYPPEGGIGAFAGALASKLGNIIYDAEVSEIRLAERRIVLKNGHSLRYDKLIATLPLPELAKISRGCPQKAREAGRLLKWNSILNLNLGLRRDLTCGRHWVYFPQKTISFFRIGHFTNFSRSNAPEGCSSMYVELAYSRESPVSRQRALTRIKRDLAGIGVGGDDVCCEDVNEIEYAYPIFNKDYSPSRETLMRFFHDQGVFPCGRYGSWRYFSMEDCLMDGKGAAERAVE